MNHVQLWKTSQMG